MPDLVKAASVGANIMKQMVFSEDAVFYELLDHHVELGSVCLSFPGELPGQDSKLWKRLARCHGWGAIEAEFKNISAGIKSPLAKLISPTFQARLTGGEIAIAALVVSAIFGLFMFAVYKGRNVKLVVRDKDGREAEIEITDPNGEKKETTAKKSA